MILGFGIGAVTAAFSIVDAALLRPPPYPHADQIVAVSQVGQTEAFNQASYGVIEALRANTRTFRNVTGYENTIGIVHERGSARTIAVTRADPSLFRMLGVTPRVGRTFSRRESADDMSVAVISERLRRNAFAASVDPLGQRIEVGGTSYTVIGVMPAGFAFENQSEIWLPLTPPRDAKALRLPKYKVLAELADGVSRAEARQQVALLEQQLRAAQVLDSRNEHLEMRDGMLDRTSRAWMPVLALFFVVAALVLLVACVNVASLLAVRTAARQREFAVRAALGGGRRELARTVVVEAGVLVAVAGALGIVLASELVVHLPSLLSVSPPAWFQLVIDWRVLVVSLGVGAVAVLLVSATPIKFGVRPDLVEALKMGGEGGATSGHLIKAGRRSVVLQTAISFVLAVAAVLVGVSYLRLIPERERDVRARIVEVTLASDPVRIPDALKADVDKPLVRALLGSGQVLAVARRGYFRGWQSLTAEADLKGGFGIYKYGEATPAERLNALLPTRFWTVSDNYFAAYGLTLLRGRLFMQRDAITSARVAVISAQFAREVWADEDAIGQVFTIGNPGVPVTVIGIVSDARDFVATPHGIQLAAEPDVFISERQGSSASAVILGVRGKNGRSSLLGVVAAHMGDNGTEVEGYRIGTALEAEADTLLIVRAVGGAIVACALIAAILSLVGLYATVEYATLSRVKEMGIRMALGSTPAQTRRFTMLAGMIPVGVGVLLGAILALMVAHALRALLWQVSPYSISILTSVGVAFVAITAATCYMATRRVMSLDPAAAIRRD